jgi:hypothetical protein
MVARVAELCPYTAPMPCRVNVRIKGVSKPDVIEHGDSITKDEEKNEYTVKDAAGEVIGWYKAENVEGWWLESEPADVGDLSDKDLMRLIGEVEKRGIAGGMSREALEEAKRKGLESSSID